MHALLQKVDRVLCAFVLRDIAAKEFVQQYSDLCRSITDCNVALSEREAEILGELQASCERYRSHPLLRRRNKLSDEKLYAAAKDALVRLDEARMTTVPVYGEKEGMPIQGHVNNACTNFDMKEGWPWLLTVTINLFEPQDNGLATSEEILLVYSLSQDLSRHFTPLHLLYVGLMDWNGVVNLYFYVKDPALAEQKIRELKPVLNASSHIGRDFTYTIEKDAKWAAVKRFVDMLQS